MLSGLTNLSIESETKARRSVIAASGFLMVTQNLTLANNELNFLGLKILVSQENVIATGKLLLAISLTAFLLTFLENLPRRIARMKRVFDERWWKQKEALIDSYHGPIEDLEFERDPNEKPEWDDLLLIEKKNKADARGRIIKLYRPIVMVTRTIGHFVWPIGLSYLSLYWPQALFILQ